MVNCRHCCTPLAATDDRCPLCGSGRRGMGMGLIVTICLGAGLALGWLLLMVVPLSGVSIPQPIENKMGLMGALMFFTAAWMWVMWREGKRGNRD